MDDSELPSRALRPSHLASGGADTPPPARVAGAAPIVITGTMGAADQRYFDALRRAHFPPERNYLSAHITLFHHLPPSLLEELAALFRAIAAAQRGEVSAEVASAHALTDTQLDQLKAKLTAREGRTVKLTTKVDPDLLGGLVVTIGSKRIDGSIRTRLNSLSQAMKA